VNPRTILTLSNGRGIDLREPRPEDMDFVSIAEHLAKEKRYNGATPGVEYSVAEHSVRGCDAILREIGDRTLAAYFLLHDCHEAFLKDDTTPKKQLIASIAESFGILREHILSTFDLATYRFDQAIHDAAGLQWPPHSGIAAAVKRWDLRMFVTEWRDLMPSVEHPDWTPYANVQPLADTIVPTGWRQAKALFIERCDALLPKLRSAA
jgi:hypothetical protein